MDQKCFVCAGDCRNSHFFLVNQTSKKYKTKFTSLIGDFISNEYELRIADENKICERCAVIIEKYDELKHEAKNVKSVLARQIAQTYGIETDESVVFMDKSKIFAELGTGSINKSSSKYSCKLCPHFITDSIELINTHCLYHNITTANKIDEVRVIKETTPVAKRNLPIRRELSSNLQTQNNVKNPNIQTKVINDTRHHEHVDAPNLDDSSINIQQEFEEDVLDQFIDLDMLQDPLCYSNLKNNVCMVAGCQQEFKYVCDYVRHLRLRHKSSMNHIFAVVRTNIKRPAKVNKHMCPYCFTMFSNSQTLEFHVKEHEEATKSSFLERITDFISNVMTSSRCQTCNMEISDPSIIDCNHAFAKNGLEPKINCTYCSREFYHEKLHNNHLAEEHGHCFICNTQVSSSDDRMVLVDHFRSHLSHAEFSCMFCSDIYQTKEDRLEHMKLNHSANCCTYCNDWYAEKEEIEHHIRYAHADKRMEEKASICDVCGASFKSKSMFTSHLKAEHQKTKMFSCSVCKESFRFKYLLLNHISSVHNRTVVDNENSFYKCFVCMRGFRAQNRNNFIQHLSEHKTSTSFCNDCNASFESINHLETHRERSHQDFSLFVGKKTPKQTKAAPPVVKDHPKPLPKQLPSKKHSLSEALSTRPSTTEVPHQQNQSLQEENQYSVIEEGDQFSIVDDEGNQQQQIMVQIEDGSLLNMNNFILTENGELILQNLENLLPNGQETAEDSSGGQVNISNLEQFLMEQGMSNNTEISFIQQGENQVIVQNEDGTVSQSSQGSLMQTYKEIFEPDDDIPTELISTSETPDENASQNMLLNGDFLVQSIPGYEQSSSNGAEVFEQIEVQSTQVVDANQSTLDELGDILLEVAAAAEKEKKPKTNQATKTVREALWGKTQSIGLSKHATKKRHVELPDTTEQPASNFSQAYEFFVKGFDAKKQKQM